MAQLGQTAAVTHAIGRRGTIDTATIAELVSGALGRPPREVRALTGGISNLTFLTRMSPPADPEAVIVRVFAERERARSEKAALQLLANSVVPAPQLLGHGRIEGAGWFVISTRIRGRPVARPDDRGWLEGLAAALAAIHGISRHGRGLGNDPGPTRSWIDEGPEPKLGPLAQVLWPELERSRAALALGPAVLVHGDFHAGNVHWAGRKVVGVIDWEMARWGPAAADVAYCYLDLVLAAGRRAAERFLAAYTHLGGAVPGFDAWLLLATLRPLPDPADWLPSYEGAGWNNLTATLLRRRLSMLARSLA